MTLYDGPALTQGSVSLHEPDLDSVAAAIASTDLAENQWLPWHVRAAADDAIVYFSVSEGERLVGQAMLHDIDRENAESLVGYHLFQPHDRRRGIGTAALSMLCDYAFAEMNLRRFAAITGVENVASQRLAEKCRSCGWAPREKGRISSCTSDRNLTEIG